MEYSNLGRSQQTVIMCDMKSMSDTQAPSVRHVTIDAANVGQRIDNFLRLHLKGVPKARIYRGLRKGEVRVNKGRVRQDYKLRDGDSVRIPPLRINDARTPVTPGNSSLATLDAAILYEDSRLLLLNKPPGWAVHGGSGRSYGIIEALRALRPSAPYLELVHRLDRDTSGCLMIAKTRSALTQLHTLLRASQVTKSYLTLVNGSPRKNRLQISSSLRKQVMRSGERMVQTDEGGKSALTIVDVLDRTPVASLLRARIITGRTHQIRVHLSSVGHQIAGDEKYGSAEFNKTARGWGLKRLFLHAHRLSFKLGGEAHQFEAPLPDSLHQLLIKLGLEMAEENAD
jgi:23S rRNA pseudouridine955/2504/2580 synthase